MMKEMVTYFNIKPNWTYFENLLSSTDTIKNILIDAKPKVQ